MPKLTTNDERIFALITEATQAFMSRADTQWDRDAREAASAFIKSAPVTAKYSPEQIAEFASKIADGLDQHRRARTSKGAAS